MKSKTYRFQKGQRLMLDAIQDVQGIHAGSWWWEHISGTSDEEVLITRDITINVRIWQEQP